MAKRATKKQAATIKSDELSLTINFELPEYEPEGYESEQVNGAATVHTDLQFGARHAAALFRLREALRDKRVILNNRPVWSNVDVIRWLLEMVSVNCVKQDST